MNSLEDERDYLLQSIAQLDLDYEQGAISDEEYKSLRDSQTVRCAAVLDAIEKDPVVLPHPPRAKSSRKWAWIGGCAAFVVVTVGVLVGVATDRLAGDNSTGSVNGNSSTLLARAAQQSSDGKILDAVKTYDAVLKQNPNNVQALTYRGWLVRLAGLPAEGLQSIDKAIAADPAYPDAHFFKGFILFRDRQDPKAAIPEFQAFLANNPPSDMVPLVQQTLEDAQLQAAAKP